MCVRCTSRVLSAPILRLTGVALRARARVLVQRLQGARAAILARLCVARILDGNLAKRGGEANRAGAVEAGRPVLVQDGARAVVLAARPGAGVAGIGVLAEVADVAGGAAAGGKRRRFGIRQVLWSR